MNITEWKICWGRIKKRYPKWQPTDVEVEDWCLALRVYDSDMVEDVSRFVRQQYTSQIPTIKWFILEIEKRLKKLREVTLDKNKIDPDAEWEEHQKAKEEVIKRLENTSIDELRAATVEVLKEFGHLITKPTSANPREWKPTLRAMVYIKLYGESENVT